MTELEDTPKALARTSYAAWSRECDELESELPAVDNPRERWFHLVLLTNAMNQRFKVVEAKISEFAEQMDGADADDPAWPEASEFIGWGRPWVANFKVEFDRRKEGRERLLADMSQEEIEQGETELASRFGEIQFRVKNALLKNLHDLETGAAAAEGLKVCPDCGEKIKVAARKCRYCSYRFDQ